MLTASGKGRTFELRFSTPSVPSSGKVVALVEATDRGTYDIKYRAVDCDKIAHAPVADLDCETDMGCADWQQTYKAMRAEALVVGGGGGERRSTETSLVSRGDRADHDQDSLRQLAQSYMRCMQAFVEKQPELALTTLASNTVKGDKLHAKKVRQHYAAAHAYFLGVRSPSPLRTPTSFVPPLKPPCCVYWAQACKRLSRA